MVVRANWGRASRGGTKSLVRTIVLGLGVCLGGLVLVLRPGLRVPFGLFPLGPRHGPDGGFRALPGSAGVPGPVRTPTGTRTAAAGPEPMDHTKLREVPAPQGPRWSRPHREAQRVRRFPAGGIQRPRRCLLRVVCAKGELQQEDITRVNPGLPDDVNPDGGTVSFGRGFESQPPRSWFVGNEVAAPGADPGAAVVRFAFFALVRGNDRESPLPGVTSVRFRSGPIGPAGDGRSGGPGQGWTGFPRPQAQARRSAPDWLVVASQGWLGSPVRVCREYVSPVRRPGQ